MVHVVIDQSIDLWSGQAATLGGVAGVTATTIDAIRGGRRFPCSMKVR